MIQREFPALFVGNKTITDFLLDVMSNCITRWYPRGIQILVSTYVLGQDLPTIRVFGGGGGFLQSKLKKKLKSAKKILNFNFGDGGWGYSAVKTEKLKVPRKA